VVDANLKVGLMFAERSSMEATVLGEYSHTRSCMQLLMHSVRIISLVKEALEVSTGEKPPMAFRYASKSPPYKKT